jgi:hypothetical protein
MVKILTSSICSVLFRFSQELPITKNLFGGFELHQMFTIIINPIILSATKSSRYSKPCGYL